MAKQKQQRGQLDRTKKAQIGVRALFNALEPVLGRLVRAGLPVLGMLMPSIMKGVTDQIGKFAGDNPTFVSLVESSLGAGIVLLFPEMGEVGETIVHESMDIITDALREALQKEDQGEIEALFKKAGEKFGAKIEEDFKKKAPKKESAPSFAFLAMELEFDDALELSTWFRYVEQHHPEDYEFIQRFVRTAIKSSKELKRLADIRHKETDVATLFQLRMDYLRFTYDRPLDIAQRVKQLTDDALAGLEQAAQGRETPQLRALRASVTNVSRELEMSARRNDALYYAQRNDEPVWEACWEWVQTHYRANSFLVVICGILSGILLVMLTIYIYTLVG